MFFVKFASHINIYWVLDYFLVLLSTTGTRWYYNLWHYIVWCTVLLIWLSQQMISLTVCPLQHGETPVWSASCQGHTAVVQLLIENGADVTICKEVWIADQPRRYCETQCSDVWSKVGQGAIMPKAMLAGPSNDAALQLLLLYLWMLFLCID